MARPKDIEKHFKGEGVKDTEQCIQKLEKELEK